MNCDDIVHCRGSISGSEGLEDSHAHNPATVCEFDMVSGEYLEELMDIFQKDLIDWFGEVITNVPVSSALPISASLSHLLKKPVPQPHLHWYPSAP